MKKLAILATLFLIATPVLADGHKNSNQFKQRRMLRTENGIAELLMVQDYYWQELEKDAENKEL